VCVVDGWSQGPVMLAWASVLRLEVAKRGSSASLLDLGVSNLFDLALLDLSWCGCDPLCSFGQPRTRCSLVPLAPSHAVV
jgi:hypothetical protein